MSPSVDRVVARIRDAEEELARDVREQQQRWRYRVRRGRIWFDEEARRAHKRLKQSIPAFLRDASVLNLLTTPIAYSLLLPLVLLDLWATAYQWTCFPLYRVDRVRRRRYFIIDRHTLGYLNVIEKANCLYCSYASGVLAYVREIAARTEQYWCPIKHARPVPTAHSRYHLFFDYGDAVGYRRHLPALRKALRRPRARPSGRTRHVKP